MYACCMHNHYFIVVETKIRNFEGRGRQKALTLLKKGLFFGTPKFRPLEDTLAIGTSTHVCGSYHSLWVYGGLEPWPNDHCVLEGSILVFSSFSEEGPTALGRNRLALPVRPAGFFHCEHCWRRYCPLGIEGGTFGVSNTCV